MKISIIIPTVGRGEISDATFLHAYRAIIESGIDGEIVIVNDKKNNKITLPFTAPSFVKILENPSSGAAGKARNFGVKNAKGNLLLFIDDDILITSENLQTTLALHANHPNSAFNLNWKFTPEIWSIIKQNQFGRFLIKSNLIDYKGWVTHHDWEKGGILEVDRLAAFYFSIEKKVFESIGGFNEIFQRQAVEDDELSFRLQKQGVKLFIDTENFVLHNEKDKLFLENRMLRMKSMGMNFKAAVKMGYSQYSIYYSLSKKTFYSIIRHFKSFLHWTIFAIPNNSLFDFFYFKIANLLVGIAIFEGYNNIE